MIGWWTAWAACVSPDVPESAGPAARAGSARAAARGTNVLLIVADDLGADQMAAFSGAPDLAPTPNLTRLADVGVRFDRAYAMPTCSPSRAALFTGRYPERTGIGTWMDVATEPFELPLSELTIPEVLDQGTVHPYANALFGKWHLTGVGYPSPAHHPLDQGFDWFEGTLDNLGGALNPDGRRRDYFHWEKDTNGVLAYTDDYATSRTVDDALARIPKLPEPWFVAVTLHAPHVPLHVPPPSLHSQALPPDHACGTDKFRCWSAMVEAMDTEVGRLVASLDPDVRDRTTVIFTSDNGSTGDGIRPPFDPARHKGSLFDGGTRVPLIVAGPQVASPGARSDGFVNLVDLLPTIAEIAEVDLSTLQVAPQRPVPPVIDGVSFLAQIEDPTLAVRDDTFVQWFLPNGGPPWPTDKRMIRDADHKLIRVVDAPDLFFRYDADAVDEGPDLLSEGPLGSADLARYDALSAALDAASAALTFEGP